MKDGKKLMPEIKGFFPETKGNGLIVYHSLDNIKKVFLHPNGASHIELDYFGTERRGENEHIHTESYQDFLEALRDYRRGIEMKNEKELTPEVNGFFRDTGSKTRYYPLAGIKEVIVFEDSSINVHYYRDHSVAIGQDNAVAFLEAFRKYRERLK